jgi:glycosyltransferase involved in cell wall biosynthesis
MRILHVVPTYLPATRYGGPIFSVHGLASAQAALGADVSVLTTSVDGAQDSPVVHGQACLLDGVKVWYFRSRWFRRLYFSWAMRQWLKANVAMFDVVHLHSVFLFPTNMAARLCIKAGIPYVIAPRGMLVPELISEKRWFIKAAWIRLFERRTLAKAACFHATSTLELDDARRLGVPINNPCVIENGVALPEQRDWPVPIQVPYVLYLGRLSWKKNIDLLIEACSALPDVHLVLAGAADQDAMIEELRTLTNTLSSQARVSFLGELKGGEKWPWIQHARVLALVSKNENFGNAAAEALCFGTPVVLSNGVGLAAAASAAGAGWVCEPNVESIRTAINAAFCNPQEAKLRGARGQEWAKHTLGWQAGAGKTMAIYQSFSMSKS